MEKQETDLLIEWHLLRGKVPFLQGLFFYWIEFVTYSNLFVKGV